MASPPPRKSSFVIVRIPAVDDEPIDSFELNQPEELDANLGCLTAHLNDHFRKHGGAVTDDNRAKLIDHMRQHVAQKQQGSGGAASTPPDETMLAKMAASQTCDIVQLLPATRDSDYYGVTMYVDDQAVAKGSPMNRRASEVCVACGLSTEIRGDAFVSRSWDDQDGYVRLDFGVDELQSDATWLSAARRSHERRPDVAKAASMLKASPETPREPSEPHLDPQERLQRASDLKAAGTEAFRAAEYAGAAALYQDALRLYDPPPEDLQPVASEVRVACLLNLASCNLRLERPIDAIGACDAAVALDATSAKAWFRRAQACMKMRQYEAARKNLVQAAKLAPGSREIRDELERCTAALADARGGGFRL